jgi:uncharacterized protein HemX
MTHGQCIKSSFYPGSGGLIDRCVEMSSAKKVIDWVKILSKSSPESRKLIITIRNRNDELKRQLLELSNTKPKIDFAKYSLVDGGVIEANKSRVNSFAPTKKDLASTLADLEVERREKIKKAQEFLTNLESDIAACQAKLSKLEASKPLSEMSVEEVYQVYPELKTRFEEKLKRDDWYIEDTVEDNAENAHGKPH